MYQNMFTTSAYVFLPLAFICPPISIKHNTTHTLEKLNTEISTIILCILMDYPIRSYAQVNTAYEVSCQYLNPLWAHRMNSSAEMLDVSSTNSGVSDLGTHCLPLFLHLSIMVANI